MKKRHVEKPILAIMLCICTAALFSFTPCHASSASSGSASYKNDEVLLVFKDDVSRKTAAKTAAKEDGSLVRSFDIGNGSSKKTVATVKTDDDSTVSDAAKAYSSMKDVAYAQPNYRYEATDIDTTLDLNDPYYYAMWHFDKVSALKAWKLIDSAAHSKVKVAVIDTGIMSSHSDLLGNVDESLCYDATLQKQNSSLEDGLGHGTHVCGIIGATSENSIGVAGVGSGDKNDLVDLFAVKVFTGSGAFTDDIIKGISYACSSGAKVINMIRTGSI